MSSLAEEVQQVVDDAAQRIADLARKHLATQVQEILASSGHGGTPTGSIARSVDGRSYPACCLALHCKLAHGGPKSQFLCPTHRLTLSAEERKALRESWQETLKAQKRIYDTRFP